MQPQYVYATPVDNQTNPTENAQQALNQTEEQSNPACNEGGCKRKCCKFLSKFFLVFNTIVVIGQLFFFPAMFFLALGSYVYLFHRLIGHLKTKYLEPFMEGNDELKKFAKKSHFLTSLTFFSLLAYIHMHSPICLAISLIINAVHYFAAAKQFDCLNKTVYKHAIIFLTVSVSLICILTTLGHVGGMMTTSCHHAHEHYRGKSPRPKHGGKNDNVNHPYNKGEKRNLVLEMEPVIMSVDNVERKPIHHKPPKSHPSKPHPSKPQPSKPGHSGKPGKPDHSGDHEPEPQPEPAHDYHRHHGGSLICSAGILMTVILGTSKIFSYIVILVWAIVLLIHYRKSKKNSSPALPVEEPKQEPQQEEAIPNVYQTQNTQPQATYPTYPQNAYPVAPSAPQPVRQAYTYVQPVTQVPQKM